MRARFSAIPCLTLDAQDRGGEEEAREEEDGGEDEHLGDDVEERDDDEREGVVVAVRVAGKGPGIAAGRTATGAAHAESAPELLEEPEVARECAVEPASTLPHEFAEGDLGLEEEGGVGDVLGDAVPTPRGRGRVGAGVRS